VLYDHHDTTPPSVTLYVARAEHSLPLPAQPL